MKIKTIMLFFSVIVAGMCNAHNVFAVPTLTISSTGAQTANVGAADNNIAINTDTINVATSCR